MCVCVCGGGGGGETVTVRYMSQCWLKRNLKSYIEECSKLDE